MIKLEDNNFIVDDKKDKAWLFVMKTLKPIEKPIIEDSPWINQAMLDWSVQVLLGNIGWSNT